MALLSTGPSETEIVDTFPHSIREIEFEKIPLADGTHLTARYWLPVDALENPVPAILEYIPYCTRDGTAARDEAMHPYFAGHGYAAVRVDIRGSGESEGVLLDEYLKQEQDDAVEVIAWIADQPWCDGNVGMMGKSWGGFNGLQVAARRPPALKCIVTLYFTDDRYADDVHYMGGCYFTENPSWAFVMFSAMARPPDPALVGDSWRDMWQARLDAIEPWIFPWTRHQRRDDFWKHGSVCENFEDINIPVYAMGGWADIYTNPMPRLHRGLDPLCKTLIGPWGHQYMHQVVPGPGMGFMDEAMRWWDHWLKGKETGVMDEPSFRYWVQDSVKPGSSHKLRPGYWASCEEWPDDKLKNLTWHLNHDGKLTDESDAATIMDICSPQTTGVCTPRSGNMGAGEPEDPLDQRSDDSMSLCFDSEVLTDDMTMAGAPIARLRLSSNEPTALVCVRLNEIRADGSSLQVTVGILNLTHRDSHLDIESMNPGKQYDVCVPLNDIAHTFSKGSRVRVAISTAFWPMVWPSPRPVTLSIETGNSTFSMPSTDMPVEDLTLPVLAPPRQSRPHPTTVLREGKPVAGEMTFDLKSGLSCWHFKTDTGLIKYDAHGWIVSSTSESDYYIHPDDPMSARLLFRATDTYAREKELEVRIESFHEVTCDEDDFIIDVSLRAYDFDKEVYAREWHERIPRDGV
jgi:putative CocE/NonD family hydrolase